MIHASASPPPSASHKWLAGFDDIDLAGVTVVSPGQHLPQRAAQRTSSRCVILSAADQSSARRVDGNLVIRVAPSDHLFACAIITAFCAAAAMPAAAAPASRALLTMAARVASHEIGILIEGATGTGKEGLARLVHTLSPRRDAPFVAVNCAALPEAMLEATLFGHERGAFTGATASSLGLFRGADGGTLLLDEISELPLPLQAKLLRVLQEREVMPIGALRPEKVNVRIIAAANRDLAADVGAGRFRADLFYRLAVFPLRTIPLRERRADIVAIAAHWLLRLANDRLCWPTPAALSCLLSHDWPGNVRELGNVLDRAAVLGDGNTIEAADLCFDSLAAAPVPEAGQRDLPLPGSVRHHEDRVIRRALEETSDRRSAAQRLGISERTLRYKLAAMAIRPRQPMTMVQ